MCVFCLRILAHEIAGAARTRSSLRPLFFRGATILQQLGQLMSRECGIAFVVARMSEARSGNPTHSPGYRYAHPGYGTARTWSRIQPSSSGLVRNCALGPDDPVFRGVGDGNEKLRRTGYSAFAEYDDLLRSNVLLFSYRQ
jgi:hypothetical protein